MSTFVVAIVVNQIQFGYNGFGDVITQYQEHGGSVNTSTSDKIQWAFAEGSGNTDRMTSQTFNNGRILHIGYNNNALDNDISRADFQADDNGSGGVGTHLEDLYYLGLGTVVKRAHPEPGVDETLIGSGTGDGGDQYTGIDRFGRIVIQNWTNGTTSLDEYEYGYDRNGNALYQKNDLSSVNSELYHLTSSTSGDNNSAYDNLDRLAAFRRGTLSSSGNNGSGLDTVSTLSTTFSNYQQTWNLDALGNWSSLAADGGSAVGNSFNSKNQETAQGSNSLTFDNDGNTTTDDAGNTYKYDGWNHIIQVKDNTGTIEITCGDTDRLTSMTYPNGRILDYGYSTGIDANISRLSFLADDVGTSAGVHLEEYKYLGLNIIVIRNRPENNTELTYVQQSGDTHYITDGGDQYTGLDRAAKLNDGTLALWSQILRKIESARLVLLGAERDGDNAFLRAKTFAAGIDPARVRMLARLPRWQYLAALAACDIALDPFPYNGDTTTCDALWMGLPVVSLSGERFAARRGVGLLSAVGLEDWVAATPMQYLSIAIRVAGDLAGLSHLRATLPERLRQSALCNGQRYTGALEAALETMVRG